MFLLSTDRRDISTQMDLRLVTDLEHSSLFYIVWESCLLQIIDLQYKSL